MLSSETVTRSEIRSVLVRHWRTLDRARLHTLHLWMFIYAIAQIFIMYYFSEILLPVGNRAQSVVNREEVKKWAPTCFFISITFVGYLLISGFSIRFRDQMISFLLQQLMISCVGIVSDSNEAANRADIAMKLTEAVYRRTELESLKDRQVVKGLD
uniref:Bestrophin homolog n=1 Tax=Angiostrongylus cantonensis TaxID=6313 RepID=A0A158PC98_ANGCA